MKLGFSLFLSLSFISLCASANAADPVTVTVTDWDGFKKNASNGSDIVIIEGTLKMPSNAYWISVSAGLISGNPGSGITVSASNSSGDAPFLIIEADSGKTQKVEGLTFSGDMTNVGAIMEVASKVGSSGIISSCTFDKLTAGNAPTKVAQYMQAFVRLHNVNTKLAGSTFTNNINGTVAAYVSNRELNTLQPGEIFDLPTVEDCTFANNATLVSSKEANKARGVLSTENATIKGCTFTQNYVGTQDGVTSRCLGGAIYAGCTTNITDSQFKGNFVMASGGEYSAGGAIYSSETDGWDTIINIRAEKTNVTFSGNKMGVTKVENGKAVDGTANAITMDGNKTTLSASATEGKRVEFFDPIILHSGFDYDSTNKTNKQRIFYLNKEAGDTGTVVFSGELYKEQADANRMTLISSSTGFTQYDGKVQITQKAIVGASLTSTDEKTAKVGALNYVQTKGTLEVSDGGHLMAGSVHIDGNGSANSGYELCVVSAGGKEGETAQLTTGWLFMDQGVSFDLNSFTDITGDRSSGLKVNIVQDVTFADDEGNTIFPNTLDGKTPIYSSSDPRINLGGTLGIVADAGNYTGSEWDKERTFLLFDFGNQELTGDFDTDLKITGLETNVVEGQGFWARKTEGGKFYAVWTPTGPSVPEPSSMSLVLFGFAALATRRRRTV